MYGVILCVVALTTTLPRDDLTPTQLQNLLAAFNADLKDLELMYEGSVLLVRSTSDESQRARYSFHFQGTTAFRRDGAAHLELYRDKTLFGGDIVISKYCTINKRVFEQLNNPDERSGAPAYTEVPGGIPTLNRSASYFRLFALPSVALSHHYYIDNACEIVGWEEVAGRRCLKVDFKQGHSVERYWLDLERGGNPLKFEFIVADQLRYRVDEVELESFPTLGGADVWIPVRGVARSYMDASLKTLSEPLFEETYKVLDGSVILNQDLGDDRFSLGWNAKRKPEKARPPSLKSLKRGPDKIDLASVDRRLEEQLAEADRQSERLIAGSPGAESFSFTAMLQAIGLFVGSSFLAIAFYLRYRS